MKKNIIWNTIGLSFNAFNSLFLLIVVNKINGIDNAGVFTYSFSLCALFYVISMFYTRTYQLSNYNDDKLFKDFLMFRIFTIIISFLLIIVFSVINRFNNFKLLTILFLMIFRILEAFSDCFYAEIQKNDKLYSVGISLTLKALIGIILFIIVDLLTLNMILSILSLVVINIIVFVFYDYKVFRKVHRDKIKFTFKFDYKKILKESTSIFLFTFLLIYMTSVQKYVMPYYLNNSFQTIFGILIMPSTMLSLVGNYILMPFLNGLTSSVKSKNYDCFYNKCYKIMGLMIVFGILIFLVTYLIGIPVLNIIYSIDLNKYKNDLLIIVFASIISALAIMISNFLQIIKINNSQLIIYFICSIISTIISIVLISNYDVRGASVAYFISYALLFSLYVILFIKSKRKLR